MDLGAPDQKLETRRTSRLILGVLTRSVPMSIICWIIHFSEPARGRKRSSAPAIAFFTDPPINKVSNLGQEYRRRRMSTTDCATDAGVRRTGRIEILSTSRQPEASGGASRPLKGCFSGSRHCDYWARGWQAGMSVFASWPPMKSRRQASICLQSRTRNHRMQWFNRRFPVCICKWLALGPNATRASCKVARSQRIIARGLSGLRLRTTPES